MSKEPMDDDKKPDFVIEGIVEPEEVPTWARKPSKYDTIIEQIMKMDFNKTLRVRFPSVEAAMQAHHAIRDRVNLRSQDNSILRVRTTEEEGAGICFFTKLDRELLDEEKERRQQKKAKRQQRAS